MGKIQELSGSARKGIIPLAPSPVRIDRTHVTVNVQEMTVQLTMWNMGLIMRQ